MFCSECGHEIKEGDAFCPECGHPVQPEESAATTAAAASVQQAAPAQNAAGQSTAPEQPQPAVAPSTAYVDPSPSPLKRAWADFSQSPNKGKTLALLMLTSIFPILNFFVTGYCVRWAKGSATGDTRPLPRTIFAEGGFAEGFKVTVVSFTFSMIVSSVILILFFVPILGWLAIFVLDLFWFVCGTAITMIAIIRMATKDKLSAAFDFGQLAHSLKRRFGQLWVSVFVPNLIPFAISIIAGVVLLAMTSGISYSAYYGLRGVTFGSIILICFVTLLFIVAICVVSVVVQLVVYRAVGYWAKDNVPEWPAGKEIEVPVASKDQQPPTQPTQA